LRRMSLGRPSISPQETSLSMSTPTR